MCPRQISESTSAINSLKDALSYAEILGLGSRGIWELTFHFLWQNLGFPPHQTDFHLL